MKKKHDKKPNYFFYLIGFLAVLSIGVYLWQSSGNRPGDYDEFAKCLAASGTKMYGAFWCSHCNNQKEDFGRSSWKIFADAGGYVECSTPERQQTEVCRQAGITGYPTWRFPGGSEQSGEVDFYTLSQKSGCPLVPK
jgi:hypothetical protein